MCVAPFNKRRRSPRLVANVLNPVPGDEPFGSLDARQLWRSSPTPSDASVDWRNRALAALLLVGLVVAFARLDVRAILAAVDATVLTYQEAAPVLTAVGGVLLVANWWIMVLIPSTVLELTLGYVFGLRLGFACVYLGKVAGCLGSFLLGRTVLRARCQRWFERHELFLAIDSVVAAAPYRICVLLRASYIPIAFKNYGFSVLSVPTRPFVVALLGVEIFNSFLLVFIGSAGERTLLRADDARAAAVAAAAGRARIRRRRPRLPRRVHLGDDPPRAQGDSRGEGGVASGGVRTSRVTVLSGCAVLLAQCAKTNFTLSGSLHVQPTNRPA